MAIEVFINGKKESIDEGKNLAELLKDRNIKKEIVTVELNSQIVDKNKYNDVKIRKGDKIDFVYYMGGGARWKHLMKK